MSLVLVLPVWHSTSVGVVLSHKDLLSVAVGPNQVGLPFADSHSILVAALDCTWVDHHGADDNGVDCTLEEVKPA